MLHKHDYVCREVVCGSRYQNECDSEVDFLVRVIPAEQVKRKQGLRRLLAKDYLGSRVNGPYSPERVRQRGQSGHQSQLTVTKLNGR